MRTFINIFIGIAVLYAIYYVYAREIKGTKPLPPTDLLKDAFNKIIPQQQNSSAPQQKSQPQTQQQKEEQLIRQNVATVGITQYKFDSYVAETIRQWDKAIYEKVGWKEFDRAKFNDQVATTKTLPGLVIGGYTVDGKRLPEGAVVKGYNALCNQWEIVKWQVAAMDGYYPSLPVPAQFTNYGLIDSSGRYYLNNFGKNYYYAVTNQDKIDTLQNFLNNWKHYATYKPPSDGQAAVGFLKLAVKMIGVA